MNIIDKYYFDHSISKLCFSMSYKNTFKRGFYPLGLDKTF